MLIKEMRGRDSNERNRRSSRNGSDGGTTSSSHTPEEESSHENGPEQQSSAHSSTRSGNDGIDIDDVDPPSSSYESISERFQYYLTKSVAWYHSQSEDMQTILKVSFALVLLYVALGGRFGLEYVFQKQQRGNYGRDNVYDRYNSAGSNSDRYGYASESSSSQGGNANRAQPRTESSGYNDRSNPRNDQYYSRYSHHDDEQYYEPRQTRSRSTTYHMPNLFDGSFTSMIILFAIGTICHRFGVNPFQIFWLLQAMQRGGRHYHGYGGFGGGFGRRRMGRRGRW